MGKGPIRVSKTRPSGRNNQIEDSEDDEKASNQRSSFSQRFKEYCPDPVVMLAIIALILMVGALVLVLWVNYSGGIDLVINDISREVEVLDMEWDQPEPHTSRKRDRDDLSDSDAALEAIERFLQHGDTESASRVAAQLASSKTFTADEISGLFRTINETEAANPIVDAGRCRAEEVLSWIREMGGAVEGLAVVDAERTSGDGRGRGLAATKSVRPGARLMSVPPDLFMSAWTAERSTALKLILASHGEQLNPFNILALMLLTESHNTSSFFRRYICSLPLHIPLPLLWDESELPTDFLADATALQGRRSLRALVDSSYKVTVPPLIAAFPALLKAEHFTPAKWTWACSVLLSRAVAARRPPPRESTAPEPPPELVEGSNRWVEEAMTAVGPPGEGQAIPVLIPGVDLLNHQPDPSRAARLSLDAAGNALVAAGSADLRRGKEVARTYASDTDMCGARPLNRFGFPGTPCPAHSESDATQAADGTTPAAAVSENGGGGAPEAGKAN